ncbi:MAG: nucleoside triphosphate pyrophosphohydrolase [Clostridia bacterium]|nr:nucleoside triphosphate pyrophosphohydrolase [Clostridia bacterium]
MNGKLLYIAPISVGDGISLAALRAIEGADRLYCQTLEHSTAKWLAARQPVSMDDLYAAAEDFDALNRAIARRVTEFEGSSATYAVLGGAIGGAQLAAIEACARERGIAVELLPGAGFGECALAAAGLSRGGGVTVCPAASLTERHNPYIALCIEEIDSCLRAGEVKLALCEYYPDGHEVVLAHVENGAYALCKLKLCEIDRRDCYGADCVLIVPPVSFEELDRHGMDELLHILRMLRAPGGCPWDAKQTHESLKTPLIEEAYEVLDAINEGDEYALAEELGDLLLQVAFHAQIEEELGTFNFRDVCTGIVKKLIYRHPHVFADGNASTPEEVLVTWEQLKRVEKRQQSQSDAIAAVPKSFPALMHSYKIQKRAADVGFDWQDAQQAFYKIAEETDEVAAAMRGDGSIDEELGDLLFAVVNVCRLLKRDPELCLYAAAEKFASRFTQMESAIIEDGKSITGMSLDEMDEYWNAVKRSE